MEKYPVVADTTVKSEALKAIEEMPQDVTFNNIMERLYFLYKVDAGIKQVEVGDSVSHEAAKKRIKTWHK